MVTQINERLMINAQTRQIHTDTQRDSVRQTDQHTHASKCAEKLSRNCLKCFFRVLMFEIL